MPLLPLRRYSSPDLSNFVIHFTGRIGRPNDEVPGDIAALGAGSRLLRILSEGRIQGFRTFGLNQAVVCFTEASPAGVSTLVREQRYHPWGLAFTKDFVFAQGGGPALYVRGDEWASTFQWPDHLRARAARLWPGMEIAEDDPIPPSYMLNESEWTHEREWRVPCIEGRTEFRFSLSDVAFVIAPTLIDGPDGFGTVAVNRLTGEIVDPRGHWLVNS